MASEKKKRKKARKLLRKAQQMEPYRPGQHLSPSDLMRRYYGTGISYTGLSGGGAPGGGGGGGLSALLLEVGKLGGQLNALLSQRKKETTATESMGDPGLRRGSRTCARPDPRTSDSSAAAASTTSACERYRLAKRARGNGLRGALRHAAPAHEPAIGRWCQPAHGGTATTERPAGE